MNQDLKTILDFIQQSEHLSEENKIVLTKATKDADKALTISEFKLERTEKVKRTTAILLEETIDELEQKQKVIKESNEALQKSLQELKAAQAQLIQSEKMASLGELTAGIAHEIQNPLNFVNNFSEVSRELLDEMKEELDSGNLEDVREIADDVIQNLEKITHHGKRADSIVKGMLQHSRTNKGEKKSVNLNNLVDEYVRLAYHGFRAKDKSFNVELITAYDQKIKDIEIVPQDLGRVILNLVNNAFYACTERRHNTGDDHSLKEDLQGFENLAGLQPYNPKVSVAIEQNNENVMVKIQDNGCGIPKDVIDKIFQPFFTTKPTGQGTGLGLSLSYDIVKAHGGELQVETEEGVGTTFIINIPTNS